MKKINRIQREIGYYLEEDGTFFRTDEIECIEDLIAYINEQFDVDLKVVRVGTFDSTGCTLRYYAWAGMVDGELYLDSFEEVIC